MLLLAPLILRAQEVEENAPLALYISSGTNFTKVHETQYFSAFTSDGDKNYNPNQGFQLAAGVLLPITKKLSVGLGGKYSQESYSASSGDAPFISYLEETLNFISIPVKLHIAPFDSKLRPYAEFGMNYSRLLKSKMTGTRIGGTALAVKDMNIADQRTPNSFSLSFGVGVGYTFSNGSLFIVGNYFKGLTEMVIAEKRYSNSEIVGDLQYVDSDFKLDGFEISVGYAFNL